MNAKGSVNAARRELTDVLGDGCAECRAVPVRVNVLMEGDPLPGAQSCARCSRPAKVVNIYTDVPPGECDR